MKKNFSTKWKSSKQPRKQRKYKANAPLHTKQKFMGSNLSKELKKKYNRRSITLRKGDTVKVMKGQFKNKTGKVETVLLKRTKVYIGGIQQSKRDGSKAYYPIHPSNVQITELNLDDRRRKQKLIGDKK